MKKILCLIALLLNQNVFAQSMDSVSIDNVKAFKNGQQINFSFVPCEKTSCNIASTKMMDYSEEAMTKDGKSVKDVDLSEVKIDVKLITEQEKQVLEISYTENSKKGLFNEANKMVVSNKITTKTNYNIVFYVPITNEKSYKVTVQDKTDIIIKLN